MCTMGQCNGALGQWVRFRTQWGVHQGVVTQVNPRAVLMRVPRRYAPVGLASQSGTSVGDSDENKLDLALANWGYGAGAGAGAYGYGGRWGNPGYGAWGGGWWWWWLAFAWIFALAFLW